MNAATLEPLLPLARAHRLSLVSPGPVALDDDRFGFRTGALVRDTDGHGVRVIARARETFAGRPNQRQ